MTFTEQAQLFEAAARDPDLPLFFQQRFLYLSAEDILGRPMSPDDRLTLGCLRMLAELMATAIVADWSQRTKFHREERES